MGARPLMVDHYEPIVPPATPVDIPSPVVEAPEPPAPIPAPEPVVDHTRDEIAEAARALLGKTQLVIEGKRYGDDCTGFIRALFEPLGLNLMTEGRRGDNGVTAMWRFASRYGRIYEGGRPVVGDLVFFKETYDLNRDGRVNDGLTHIGLVDDIEPDGTVLVIHRVARGVVRYRMNLENPKLHQSADGKPLNDWLRVETAGSRRRLTGELFASFATVLPVQQPAEPQQPEPPSVDKR